METPQLPVKWCIKQNTDQIVCDWFNKKFNLNSQLNGNFKYITSDGWYCDDDDNMGYVEISFEQFKQYVLNEKPKSNNYTKLINMLKYINEKNRTLT